MSEQTDLTIYKRYLDLIYYTNDIVRKYPKSETFALVKEIKQSLYTGFKFIMYAIKSYKKNEKLKYLHELDVHLALFKVYVRLSNKYHYINQQNYEAWSKIITDISNMLGGWINSCLKK